MGNKYGKLEIIGRINAMRKRVSDSNLKVGDRFIYLNYDSLLFKTNHKSENGKFLCSDEIGNLVWIDGNEKVDKLNGIAFELKSYSKQFKNEFLKKDSEK